MIRVLQVIGAMNRAGAETFIMNVYRNIDRDAVQFDFLVNAENECDYDREILDLGGRIFRVPYYRIANYASYRKSVASFFDEHPEHRIVHGHIGLCAPIYLHEARLRGRYAIAHSHGANQPLSLAGLMYRASSFPVRFEADHYFACSTKAGIDRFGRAIVADSSRFDIVNNGISLDDFRIDYAVHAERKRQLGLDSLLVVGHTGRFVDAKNHGFLLRVFKEIKSLAPHAVLLLVGDGPLREDIESESRQLGIEDSVIYTGVVQDVPNWMAAMDVFVFPSRNEGLPLALVEAQAAGLPCVISDAIDESAAATDYARILTLNESCGVWADTAIKYSAYRKAAIEENAAMLRSKGFDIRDTVEKLQEFYLAHA